MANVKVVVHEKGISDFLQMNKGVRDQMVSVANMVKSEAEATASDAEEGPGGRISGYADAGFEVQWESRGGKRPRVLIVVKADKKTFLAAHFHYLLKTGYGHMAAAIYSVSRSGGKRRAPGLKFNYKAPGQGRKGVGS